MEHILIYKHLLNTCLSALVIDSLQPIHCLLCVLMSVLQIRKMRLGEVK